MPAAGTDDAGSRISPVSPFGDIQSILDIVKGLTGVNSSSITNGDTTLGGDASGLLQQLLGRLLPDLDKTDYSPEAATRDAQGIINKIMMDYKEGTLPKIYQGQNASGGYNSTTGQLMANDAFARASVQGAEAVTKNVETYGKLRQGQTNQLLNLVLGIAAVNRRTTSNTNSTTGKPDANALKKAAAAAALAQAAKNRKRQEMPNPQDRDSANGSPPDEENRGDDLLDDSGPKMDQDVIDSLTGTDLMGNAEQNFESSIPDLDFAANPIEEDLGGDNADMSSLLDFGDIFSGFDELGGEADSGIDFEFPDYGDGGFEGREGGGGGGGGFDIGDEDPY